MTDILKKKKKKKKATTTGAGKRGDTKRPPGGTDGIEVRWVEPMTKGEALGTSIERRAGKYGMRTEAYIWLRTPWTT